MDLNEMRKALIQDWKDNPPAHLYPATEEDIIRAINNLDEEALKEGYRDISYQTLKDEYISLSLALELDDICTSLSTLDGRCCRLGEIEDEVGEMHTSQWDEEVNNMLSHPETTYSSGSPYNR